MDSDVMDEAEPIVKEEEEESQVVENEKEEPSGLTKDVMEELATPVTDAPEELTNLNKEANDDPIPAEDEDHEDDDDDDDAPIVMIGDVSNYGPVNISLPKIWPQVSKSKSTKLDIEAVGDYQGEPIYDVNIEQMDDKPWRKPGADITDYFNYGFTEDTWKLYCEKQKRLRSESLTTDKVEIPSDPSPSSASKSLPIPVSSVNENSKYSALGVTKKAGPPPGRKTSGKIDVIGGGTPNTPSVITSRRPQEDIFEGNFLPIFQTPPPSGPPPPPPFHLASCPPPSPFMPFQMIPNHPSMMPIPFKPREPLESMTVHSRDRENKEKERREKESRDNKRERDKDRERKKDRRDRDKHKDDRKRGNHSRDRSRDRSGERKKRR